jgi:hypothetical protein
MKDLGCEADLLLYMYDEPSADCKLSYIIHHIRDHLNINNRIMFDSNGWGLDENTIKMLFEIGLNRIIITGYTDDIYNRFKEIKENLCKDSTFDRTRLRVRAVDDLNKVMQQDVKVYSSFNMDTRLYYYKDVKGELVKADISKFCCVKPETLLCVSATGEVVLCEYDWRGTISFGNLYKDSLESILSNKCKFNTTAYRDSMLPDFCTTNCSQAFGVRTEEEQCHKIGQKQ